eukprot:1275951-Amorphochlora_amoeboformis.AAC.1
MAFPMVGMSSARALAMVLGMAAVTLLTFPTTRLRTRKTHEISTGSLLGSSLVTPSQVQEGPMVSEGLRRMISLQRWQGGAQRSALQSSNDLTGDFKCKGGISAAMRLRGGGKISISWLEKCIKLRLGDTAMQRLISHE